ncbi:MAG: maleylpyruvate isomerase N-terminal domain-containing protein [Acidimicrobiales bacterium]
MSEVVKALRSSVTRLHEIVSKMDDSALVAPSYDTEWTNADVLSHIGSGAVIMARRLEDTAAGRETPEDFNQGVWDEWNAKSPREQADTLLVTDARMLEIAEGMSEDERGRVHVSMGPMALDFDSFVGLRLNEHALHTWDVEVMGDASLGLTDVVAAQMIDRLEMIARWTAKPTGSERVITVRTTGPERLFTITLSADRVDFAPGAVDGAADAADLELPAEAFVRLVYGRLDPDHTPAFKGSEDLLAELRQVYPGP